MRILRVANSVYPEVMGGVGLHVHHMSRVQSEMGHEVTVLTSDNGDRSLPREESRDGYRLIRHSELARPLDNSIVPGVISTVRDRQQEFDILHVHSHLYFSSTVSALLNQFSDTPLVLTNHGLVSQTAPRIIQRVFNATAGRVTFEAADRILCYTETDRDRLRERGIKSDISVVPNGIDCSKFSPGNDSSDEQILFVGRLKPGKGVDDLVEAFGALAEDHPDWELKVVGDGPLREELLERAETLGIEERITFTGEVPNAQVPDLYRESAIFALPSYSEGLPRTVLEAMATQTPVVASSLPQLEPVVDGAGLTVEPGDTDEIAEALSSLIVNSDRRAQHGSRGRKVATKTYGWEQTVKQTVDVYREVAEVASEARRVDLTSQ